MNMKNTKQEIYNAYLELQKDYKHLQSQELYSRNEEFLARYNEVRFIVEKNYLESLDSFHIQIMRDSRQDITGYQKGIARNQVTYLSEHGFGQIDASRFLQLRNDVGQTVNPEVAGMMQESLKDFDNQVYVDRAKARVDAQSKDASEYNRLKIADLKKRYGEKGYRRYVTGRYDAKDHAKLKARGD